MLISYIQESDKSKISSNYDSPNYYVDNCSSIIPFSKRDKGSLIFGLIGQKKISKIIVDSISMLGRNQIDVLNTIDFLITNNVSLTSKNEGLETMDEFGRVKSDTILLLNLLKSLANMEYTNRKESQRYGVSKAKDLGRYKGVGGKQLESIEEFFEKPKTVNILRHLRRGESIRRTAKLVGASTGLVQKVKRWSIDNNKLQMF
tara:strand:+ start:97 stop:705 length:609 start_codon:yes stop_codon:yes gene_type:complete